MNYESAQNHITGDTAVKIAFSIEQAIHSGLFTSGQSLPTVRQLAEQLKISPATVAAAYRTLRSRGLVITGGRRGTRISPHLTSTQRPNHAIPIGAFNLADGNPDPKLLPDMAKALRKIDSSPHLYGQPPHHEELVALMRCDLEDIGVQPKQMCIVSGALEGIARAINEHLRPGDRVAVEDPGFTGILDLLVSRGQSLLPVAVDDQGMQPEALREAINCGAKALIITPRAQSPWGAALSAERARDLRRELKVAPELLIVQDDHARLITESPLHCLHTNNHQRWVYLHSFSKSLNPDLRVAVITGDDTTMSRINQRMLITERWVSHILQRLVLHLLMDTSVRSQLVAAATTYTARRTGLLKALRDRRITAYGISGFNIWIPVREETATVLALAETGWAVSPGERYRLNTPPGIRITTARLEPDDAERLAEACAAVLSPGRFNTVV